MVHMLSADNHDEFSSVPSLVRFDFPYEGVEKAATLLIKASTHELRYIVRNVEMRLFFFRLNSSHIGYGLRVYDDPEQPFTIWSLVRKEDEVEAIKELKDKSKCTFFLFNETVASVAWAELDIQLPTTIYEYLDEGFSIADGFDGSLYTDEIADLFETIQLTDLNSISLPEIKWHAINNHFVLLGSTAPQLNIMTDNEGDFQESLGAALAGGLTLTRVEMNPFVEKDNGQQRELTDIFFFHQYGIFIIESKALSMPPDVNQPTRKKLAKKTEQHLDRAINQLTGACKKIKNGNKVIDANGNEIVFDRSIEIHAIALVSDLSLTSRTSEDIRAFYEKTNSVLTILDTTQLFRMMQAANMIAQHSQTFMLPVMAFDYYLMERLKTVCSSPDGRIDFDMLVRFVDEEPGT